MQTLSNGFKLPDSGDQGPVVFPALEGNIQQLNDHTHNGTNSEKLSGTSIEPTAATILLANWVQIGTTGRFKQTVTVPANITVDTATMQFRLPTGHMIFPTVEKVTATTYDVYTIDSSVDFTVLYN